MKIKTKILGGLLTMSLLVALVGGLAVNRQYAAAQVGATKEAENVARVVSFTLATRSGNLAAVQEIIDRLHATEGRDAVLTDASQMVLADADHSEVGKNFTQDPRDEVGATIRDRQVRTFIETGERHPGGIRQIVVPVEGESGQVIGAVILEYTPLYEELMHLTGNTIRQVILMGMGSAALALLLAFSMGRSIARPLQQLTRVATGLAAGERDCPMPPPRKDEIGELANAFGHMVFTRQRAEDYLRDLGDELEGRVRERTAELEKANEDLQAENAARQQAGNALEVLSQSTKRRERMLTTTLSSLNDFAYIFDREGRFVFANQPLLNLWGIALEAAVGRNFLELGYPAALAEKLQRQVQEVFATKQTITDETPYTSPAGLEGCYEYILSPAVAADGAVDFVVGSTRDITARKRAEEELRWKTALLEAHAHSSIDGILIIDQAAKKSLQNQRFVDLFKIPLLIAEEPTDERRLSWVRDMTRDPEQFVARVAHLYAHPDEIGRDEIELKDGTVLDRYSSPVVSTGGTHYGRIWTFRDITERKRSERAIEQALYRLNEAQRVAQIGDWEWDRATQAFNWSPQVFQIVGRDPRLGPPRTYEENAAHFDPVSRAWMEAKLTATLELGETQEYELMALRPNGERVPLQAMAVPRKNERGQVVGLYGTIQDITARKRAEAALRESEFRYHSLFENMLEGYAHCRMVSAEGEWRDFTYLEVNGAFETLTGLKNVVGKTINELIPGAHEADPELFAIYRRVALTGQSEHGETYSKSLGIWFSISVYSHIKGHFIAVFDNISERKRSESALLESEERFRGMFNAAATGIATSTPHGRFLQANAAFCRMLGYSEDELRERDFASLTHPDDLGLNLKLREEMLSGQRAHFVMEKRYLKKDGDIVWTCHSVSAVRAVGGEITNFIVVAEDITERKRAEEGLRVSEERLRAALSASGTGTFRWDLRTNELSWDDSLDGLFGLPPGCTVRSLETFIASVHPDDRPGVIARCEQCARDGADFTMEFRVLWPDGSLHWLDDRGKTFFDDAGQPLYMTGACVDITERKRVEQALRTSEAEFRTMAEAMPQILWITRADGWCIYFNQQWTDYTGLSLAESLGHWWNQLVHPDDRQRAWEAWQLATATVGGYALEYRLRRGDGEYHWWLVRGVPQQDAGGRVLKWFGTCTDIHDRKLAELEISSAKDKIEHFNAVLEVRVEQRTEALLAATAEAERANHAKSEFLSRMSHELRTPMNAILGFAQVLEMEEGLDNDQRDSVKQILKGGSHLLVLINEVLDITSIDAGRMTMSAEPVPLKEFVLESIGLLRPLAAELNVRLVVLPEEAPGQHVLVDRQRLKQVLLNLLANAIKYNRPGGSATLSWATLADGARGSGAAIRLSVTDTGRGLSADKLARLFNPFERLGAEQTHVEGSGLGLMLAKRMVEHMGGAIGVQSVVGQGSTFWIELPPAAAPAEEPEEPAHESALAAIPAAAAAKHTLLYVEDNPANVRLIARILARRPAIEMLSAETGALGLKMAREHRPDLIILDLHLPDSLGDEVFAQLRADRRTADIPVIVLTADAQPGRRDQLVAAGARAFLTKPVVVRTLLAAVDQFIEPAA